jgi:hypothetical protein
MENVLDIQGGGAPRMAMLSSDAGAHESGASSVVPTQPAPPEPASYDDAIFDTDWPPFTALWMLGGDSD